MNKQLRKKYLWGAATYLRGHLDAGDYNQFIFPMLFSKRICDVYDEEFAEALADSDGPVREQRTQERRRQQEMRQAMPGLRVFRGRPRRGQLQ